MVQIFKPASFLKLTDRSCLTGLEALLCWNPVEMVTGYEPG